MNKSLINSILADSAEKIGVSVTYLREVLKISKTEETSETELDSEIKKLKTDYSLSIMPKERIQKIHQLCLQKIKMANTIEKIKDAWFRTFEGEASERICYLKWIRMASTKKEAEEVWSYICGDHKLEDIAMEKKLRLSH